MKNNTYELALAEIKKESSGDSSCLYQFFHLVLDSIIIRTHE